MVPDATKYILRLGGREKMGICKQKKSCRRRKEEKDTVPKDRAFPHHPVLVNLAPL